MSGVDEWPSTPAVQDLRNILADLHHGLHDGRLVGKADAIAHAVRRAKDAGVPEDECQRMATEQFQRLFDDDAGLRKRKRRRLRDRLTRRHELGAGGRSAAQRELGPGSVGGHP